MASLKQNAHKPVSASHKITKRVDDTTGDTNYQFYVSLGEITAKKMENPSGERSHSGTAL